MKNVREIALTLLLEYEGQGKYINLSLNSALTAGLSAEEKRFLTALLYTTVEKKITYDYYISSLSGRSIDSVTERAKNILRLGFCQLFGMNGIPEYAAVNETVKLAGNKGERAFVNGVLRRALREKDNLPLPKREKNTARYLSVRYSFPLPTVKHFIGMLGEEGCEKLLVKFSEISPTDITVNTLRISADAYLEKLRELGYNAEKSPLAENSVRIFASVDPRGLPGFSEGEFFVQDASCLFAVNVLSPKPKCSLADVCAAPGGKSLAAAISMADEGEIYSFDIHENKLSLIEASAEKLGLKSIKTAPRDAKTPDSALFDKMDFVICDVPCSGLGVLAKKPDLRYKSEDSMKELPALQYDILKASSKYLKRGGRLLYSTCTLNRAENEDVVLKFTENNPEFKLIPFNFGGINAEGGFVTLYPHIHGTDGFFISLIEREK